MNFDGKTICIVPCSMKKNKYGQSAPLMARLIYDGRLTKSGIEYADKFHPDSWFILSAKYGFLRPDKRINTYDVRFGDDSAISVADLVKDAGEKIGKPARVIALTSKLYSGILKEVFGDIVETPLEGCEGIGSMIKRINDSVESGNELTVIKSAMKESDFRYYFAIHMSDWNDVLAKVLCDQPVLISFDHFKKSSDPNGSRLEIFKTHSGSVMLDSGAFSNFSSPGRVSFDEWLEFVKEHHETFDEIIQFDDLRSREKTLANFEKAKEAGIRQLFVDHLWMKSEREKVDKLWKTESKIAVSGFGKTLANQDNIPAVENFAGVVEKARDKGTFIHLLAIGSFRKFLPHFDRVHSVDSAAWAKAAAFGEFKALTTREVMGLNVPILRSFNHPQSRVQDKKCPDDLVGSVWKTPLEKLGIKGEEVKRNYVKQVVSAYNVKQYVKALKSFDFAELNRRIAEKESLTEKSFFDAPEDGWIVRVKTEKSVGPWSQYGGSSNYASKIIDRIPEHRVYVEPFMGAASVLFSKEKSGVEILSDIDIVNVFAMRFIKSIDESKVEKLLSMQWKSSKELFDKAKKDVTSDDVDDIHKMWAFLYVKRFSFNGISTFNHSVKGKPRLERLLKFAERLRDVKIIHGNYSDVIFDNDSKETFFFIDPPYPGQWDKRSTLGNVPSFKLEQLGKVVKSIKGSFLLVLGNTKDQIDFISNVNGTKFNISVNEGTRVGYGNDGLGGNKTSKRYFVLGGNSVTKRETAQVNPSGDGDMSTIKFDEVTSDLKPIVLRKPFVTLTGSVVNNGETNNDIDIIIHGPLDKETRRAVEFRIGRMFPPEISKRIQFHDESMGGPFTDHSSMYDLVLSPRGDVKTPVRMSVDKQGDPALIWPDKRGVVKGVIQLHSRAKSQHIDFRFQVDKDFLIGWTLFAQVSGTSPDVNTVNQAREVYHGYTLKDGNEFLKPILAPSKIQCEKKSKQPLVWLGIDEKVFEPGQVGATSEEEGVIISVARPDVQWGLQLPMFHEYFFTGDKTWQGILYVRFLVLPNEKQDTKQLWTCHISKEALPSVLKSRAVKQKRMPPVGHSAIPSTLEQVTPSEFRYWEADNESEARNTRDTLVESRFFTASNVKLVDGQFRRIITKSFVYVESTKADKRRYAISWLFWRGQQVVRTGPSRQLWYLFIDRPEGGIDAFELQGNPMTSGNLTAIRRRFKGKGLLAADQSLPPGESIDGNVLNDTKNTEAWIRKLSDGFVEVEEKNGILTLQFSDENVSGKWTIVQEEKGSDIWALENDTQKVYNRKLKPGDRFRPMKPSTGANIGTFRDIKPLLDKWVTDESLKEGIFVEPKWNGFRTIASRDKGENISIWFEDSSDERAEILPGLVEQLTKIKGEWIIDSELVDYDEKGGPKPRATLARFTGQVKPQDTGSTKLYIFRVLYWRELGDITSQTRIEQEKILKKLDDEIIKLRLTKNFEVTPVRFVDSKEELEEAIKWARDNPASEGAMLKRSTATYSIDGDTKEWAKLKATRRIHAMVWNRDPVKDSPGVWNYSCVIGPISRKNDFKKDEVVSRVTRDNKNWLVIGVTGNSKIDAKPGDILQVQTFELAVGRKPGERYVHWFGPATVELLRDDLRKPMSVEEVESLAISHEIRKAAFSKRLPILKTKREQFILAVVLEPNDGEDGAIYDPDSQRDIYSRDDIRQAAHGFMDEYRNIGLQHKSIINKKVRILESYISPVDFGVTSDGEFISVSEAKKREDAQVVYSGTWLLGLKIVDEKLWEKVDSGEIDGVSIGGSARRVAA